MGRSRHRKKAASFPYFPILTKLIDAKDRLSVQVHPDDKFALENEGEFGKTEMWYVIDCDEGAELIYGFKKDISSEEFERRIRDDTFTEVCNFVPVNKGDVFFIEAGTLHAIGAGILIAEVQQNSNTTYRVSDYGRIGADGKPRALHIEKAAKVIRCCKPQIPYGQVGETIQKDGYWDRCLAKCDLFKAGLIKTETEAKLVFEDNFVSLVVLDGNVTATYTDGELELKKGASLFVPKGIEIKLSGKAEVLYSYI